MENNGQELNLEALQNVEYDLADVTHEDKLSVLSSLGVMSSEGFADTLNIVEVADKEDEALEAIAKVNSDVKIDTDDIETENIILHKSDLIRAIKYASVMIKKVTNDVESSSLNITYSDEGKAIVRLKDNMTYVNIDIFADVVKEKPLLKTLSFNTTYLTKLLTASAEDFVIFVDKTIDQKQEEVEVLKVRLVNGDYILDVKEGNADKLNLPSNKTEKVCDMSAAKVGLICDVLTPLVNETQEVSSKRAILYEDRAFFKSFTYMVQVLGDFPLLCLSKKELDLLKIVATRIGSGGTVSVYKTDSTGENRLMFVAPGITISTSVSIPTRDEVTLTRLTELEKAKYMKIEKSDFRRVLFLSGLGTSTVARVTMNYDVEGNGLTAKIIGRDGNSSFTIKGDNYNNLSPKDEDVNIYAVQLMTLLKSFERVGSLEIAFLPTGVAFKNDDLQIYAIMNYAR